MVQFAVASLENPVDRDAALEIGGPEALSPLQIVKIFEEIGGKSFQIQYVQAEALKEQKQGAIDPMQQSFAALMRCYAQGDAINMHATLRAFPV